MTGGKPEMIYRNMGKSGLKISVLSYGAWVTFGTTIDVPQAKKILQQCLDGGINFFDNAEVYEGGKAESVMGQAFKELGTPRTDLVLTTKLFGSGAGPNDRGLSRKHLIEGMKASLARLQTDYVDVVYAHRPDPSVPMEETVRGFNYLIEHGMAFYWGTSEWSAEQIGEAVDIAERLLLIPPTVEQPEYNLFHRHKVEKEYLQLYDSKHGLGTTVWSPLASGLLTGKYSKDHQPEGSRLSLSKFKNMKERKLAEANLEKVDKLRHIATELGATMPQLALAWTAKNPRVTSVIMGASKQEQIVDNLEALRFIDKLTPDVLSRIDDIFGNKP